MESQQSIEAVTHEKENATQEKEDKLNKSKDSIPTDELTDLYNTSDQEQTKSQELLQKQPELEQTIVVNQSHQFQKIYQEQSSLKQDQEQTLSPATAVHSQSNSLRNSQIEVLKEIIESQRQQIEKLALNSEQYQSKIDKLTNVIANQSDEIQTLRKQVAKQNQRFNNEGLMSLNSLKHSQNSKMMKLDSSSSINERKSIANNNFQLPRNSTDFWKENDQEFYSTKNGYQSKVLQQSLIDKNKKSQRLDEIKQELWVSKEKQNQQDYVSSKIGNGSGSLSMPKIKIKQNKLQSNDSSIISNQQLQNSANKRKEKLKSSTLKKAEKKIFNEDLVEIADVDPLSSDQRETTTDKLTQKTPVLSAKPKASNLQSKSMRRLTNPSQFNKLEALKFKMSLQFKNIKLIKDHDYLMRDMEKKAVNGQKRENKIQNIQNLNRLERDLERSQKQLKNELDVIIKNAGADNEVNRNLVAECDGLFREIEEYFKQQEMEKMERLIRKDYNKIGSRIDTNLRSMKHKSQRSQNDRKNNNENYYNMVNGQEQNYEAEMNAYDEQQRQYYFQSQNHKSYQNEIQGDVGSSNFYNNGNSYNSRSNVRLPDIRRKNQ